MTDGKSPALSAERVSMGIEELKTRHGPPPWAAILVQTDRYVVTVICQAPGHRNDWHYHLAEDRWFNFRPRVCAAGGGPSAPGSFQIERRLVPRSSLVARAPIEHGARTPAG
jgi:hypothetical protein